MSSRKLFVGIFCLSAVLATLTACPPPPPPVGVVYASEGPPPLRTEVVIAAPGSEYVWVPGYWNWGGSAYQWTTGVWIRPPNSGAVWVTPRWYHDKRGWYRVGGHWR